ncbi:MAG: phosphoglycerate kinase [Actinobacteria bacterium]|nr:MAG: phosphoglycerate kinase [Actinomycetota bacterium]
MKRYLTLEDVDVAGKRVLVRSDLNVPLEEDGSISDDFRIRAAIPTLERLVSSGARVTVCSHLGRPKGPNHHYSMRAVADRLMQLMGRDVTMGKHADGEIRVMENTRFEEGETTNDPVFAARLADGQDLFVQDAFGSVHRAHASTVGVAGLVKSVAGPLLDGELTAFTKFTDEPEHPYTVVLGGAKISDKLGVIENLLPRVDQMLIGGGMCFTFLKARGEQVGASMVQDDMIESASALLEGEHGTKIVLPIDVVASTSFTPAGSNRIVSVHSMTEHEMGLDIGPQTSNLFADTIRRSQTIFWNGPMGVFEWASYRKGTDRVASAMAATEGFTGVGGGDSAAAIRALGYDDAIDHLSTGGGAGLELLEGRVLPGVEALERWAEDQGGQ